MNPEPHPIARAAAEWAVRRELGPLVERIAQYIERWGYTPPRPGGTRAKLAMDIRREFGVTEECSEADVHANLIVAADHLHETSE